MKKLIFNRIYVYLEKLNLLSVTQFGFRQNYSTTHAISYIYDKLIKNADSGLYFWCIFLDLTKAFDTVDHSKLLNKMKTQFGFRGLLLDLIQSYLTLLRLGGADCARGVKLLCAAQKLLAGIFSNFMTFPDFYSSQSWCNF